MVALRNLLPSPPDEGGSEGIGPATLETRGLNTVFGKGVLRTSCICLH